MNIYDIAREAGVSITTVSRVLNGKDNVSPATRQKVEAVLALLQSCPDYFALEGPAPTMERLDHDLANLPPRCLPSQKHYVALWRGDKPEAVLDLVEGYPRERTLFVGLFLVRGDLRRTGLGRRVMGALPAAADGAGFDRLRLGCLKNNEGGHAFWQAMGYTDLREGTLLEGGAPVWIMERLAEGK